jgi:phosphate transport system substrate-binding protein
LPQGDRETTKEVFMFCNWSGWKRMIASRRIAILPWLGLALLACCQSVLAQQSVPATPASNSTSVPADAQQGAPPAAATGSVGVDASALQHVALMHLIDSIEPYYPKGEVQGEAILAGSTTMQLLGKAWSERFRQFHPEVTFTRGKDGSEAGIREISEDPRVIAGSSRPLTDSELQALKSSKCKEPMAFIVALDPLALYVHPENPIASVTPDQLESIFRASGSGRPHAATWGDLGLSGPWKDRAIRIHSRSDISGTTGFIRNWVVQGAALARSAQVHESNEKVCSGIADDAYGIGLSSFGEANPKVRAVPLEIQGVVVPANESSFLAGRYPFVRPLVLVVDKSVMATDGGLRESILRYVLSRDGQLEAVRAGFFPVDPSYIRKQLDSISGPQIR